MQFVLDNHNRSYFSQDGKSIKGSCERGTWTLTATQMLEINFEVAQIQKLNSQGHEGLHTGPLRVKQTHKLDQDGHTDQRTTTG